MEPKAIIMVKTGEDMDTAATWALLPSWPMKNMSAML